ncbi:MAG: methyltransferase domain-containing protein [Oscillospiraceae bacterium]|nr:methyltransferase domain-containing protein [Oscillospiraceae bacterium]
MKNPIDIVSDSKHSLVHIGSLDSFDLTEGGKRAASDMLRYFDTHDLSCLKDAVKAYDRLIPVENFGGEYTALRWICKLLLAPASKIAKRFLDEPVVESWYRYLSDNNFEKLRLYIQYKYHFKDLTFGDMENSRMLRFLEDFILFSNPDRERWEKTARILRKLRIEPGLTVADVGCGSGYFTFKFADMVGPEGKVYGIEINPLHIEYLKSFVKTNNLRNVEIVTSNLDGIGLQPDVRADIVFSCSLFHVLYACFNETDRKAFIESIRRTLHPHGALIVMDNDLIKDGDLPYHGPYIAKDLLISQLHHYGFWLVKRVQVTKQRYALIFEQTKVSALPDNTNLEQGVISAMTGVSLVKYALADAAPSARYSEKGKQAAEMFYKALTDKQGFGTVADAYENIIPAERIGDEYTAFVWFCEVMKADEQIRSHMLSDSLAREYYDYFSADDFALLKRYLTQKYELSADIKEPIDNLMQIGEYIAFNNPARDRWEKTDEMLKYMGIKPGHVVADVGCGSGYFSYKFARMTGAGGKVYATEINKEALSYVESMRDRYQLNIIPVISALNDTKLPAGEIDTVFMCSMYHAVYVASIEFVKDAFIASIKNALKKDGRLIVVDNEISRAGIPDYYGSGIDRRLIISQLTHYGFRLVDEKQFIPQRYILIFQKESV